MHSLSETHQRAVKAIAFVVEKKLEELENCLLRTSLNARGIRIIHTNDMNTGEIKKVQGEIDRIYSLLDEFCAHYNIPKEEISLKREILVKASFMWEELTDAAVRKFSGYGERNETIRNEYQERINEMIEALNNIIFNTE
jgi:hypothetical protein